MREDIKVLEEFIDKQKSNKGTFVPTDFEIKAIENLTKENKELKEKYKRLSIEAQATAFDDENKDAEGLLRVLLKQGEIILDEKGYYQRKDFD